MDYLRVEKRGNVWGWGVLHVPSGLMLITGGLRLKKFAEEMRDEFTATGADFSTEKLSTEDRYKSVLVYYKWRARSSASYIDPETGEWYSTHIPYGTLATPDGSFRKWGPPSGEEAESYRATRGTRWHPDAKGIRYCDADYLGDRQHGGAWTVRLVRNDVPTAFVTVAVAVVLNRADRWSPETQIEYMIATDPADIGGTEVWSGYEYESDHAYDYETPGQAMHALPGIIQHYATSADDFTWDGVTPKLP